ncbi:DUF2065 family protein [Prosthecomicrobium pneumaticum]|uniref:Ubiquitin-binding protein n=1 Tax=Prosthecomicrobium pneumaticum TaxID=81895 RepID=A0A7W9FQM9_9HYPH|nr:hypothetical protein [Prosthecomicrobium pneumaticum]
MSELAVAIGLVLAIEGTLYAGFPSAAKAMMRQGLATPDATLRAAGLAALVLGFVIVRLAKW